MLWHVFVLAIASCCCWNDYCLKRRMLFMIFLSWLLVDFQINSFIMNYLRLNFELSLLFEFDSLLSYLSLISGATRHFHGRSCYPELWR
jgi:hypothetical protein